MKSRGFTLIELMITIAILAIIVAIAVPSYQNQIEKSRRSDAVTSLMSAAQGLERCFTRTSTYVGCSVPSASNEGYYSISATTQSATSFELEASPTSAQSGDDCGTFTLDSLGNKGDDGDAADRCWGS